MTVREMHYDFKQKLNKVDSQQNRNLLVPEIDWRLNEAQEIYVKTIAQPRLKNQYGFEVNGRTINDIRTIVVDQNFDTGSIPTKFDDSSFISDLPTDYWFLANCDVYATKGTCLNKKLDTTLVQHNDESELSKFNSSSFEWREVNIRFNSQGLRVFTDGSFVITKVVYSYLKEPRMIHNAASFRAGTYDTLSGLTLTGTSDCELPRKTHTEIVDLAVLITGISLGLPTLRLEQLKEQINNLTP